MANRNDTIDIAKGIGIMLVVFGHGWIVINEKGELFRIIFSFHMPLFFFLAGIFLRSRDGMVTFLVTRASSLLKPYFVILTALGLLKLLSAILGGTVNVHSIDYFLGLIYSTGSTIVWAPMWFLPHLFLTSIASLIILNKIESNSGGEAWTAFSATLLLLIGIYSINIFWIPGSSDEKFIGISGLPGLPWSIDLIPLTSAFIIFGYLLRERVKSMTFSGFGFIASTTIFSLLHYFFNETIDLNFRVYGDPIVSTLQAISGIYITISVASFLHKYSLFGKPLAYLGSGSLFILIFHSFLQEKAFGALSKISAHPYLNGIGSFVVAIVLSLLLWEFAKRQKLMAKLLLPQKSNHSHQLVSTNAADV